jgi:hypothetical protein
MLTGITMALCYHLPGFRGNKVIELSILRFTVRTKNICHEEKSPLNRKIVSVLVWLQGISTSLNEQKS